MQNRNSILTWSLALACLTGGVHAGEEDTLMTLSGVSNANISLVGTWAFTLEPPKEFWLNDVDPGNWDEMPVPGDVFAQGFLIQHDKPFAYKHKIRVPADFAGQRILLHFGAAHNLAKVWVNGKYVATHQGGFTPWECDITDCVQPGQSAWVAIEVTDLAREISFNGKAQRAIGGLTRSVELRARPNTFFDLPIVATPFDDAFQNATLRVIGRVSRPGEHATASFRLFDPSGNEVRLKPDSIRLDQEVVTFATPVARPVQWDAEHPNLYRLEITVEGAGQSAATYSRRIGFRDIRFDKQNNLLINGRIVKLRGGNRHLCNPTGGKVPTDEYERLDTELAKEANLNFFRTSHYPPGVGLMDHCDELGMYVTVESAIVDTGKPNRPSKGMQDDPDETKHFLSQLEEMILNYGSHPSAIIWSTANESVYGLNFLESYKLCRKLDSSRPVIASYQRKHDNKHESYDIKSMHYPRWNRDFTQVSMPTLYDEWIHVLGHGANEWFHDPNARDYWGRSLDKAWTSLFPTDGSIGGAIWNYIDDVTYLPAPSAPSAEGPRRFLDPNEVRIASPEGRGNVFGVARWGIIDEWRRKKPEFWNTKKAYSPVRLLTRRVESFEPGRPIELPVQNRFDHTDLSEITMKVTYAGAAQDVTCPALPPHRKGTLIIPAFEWKSGTAFNIEFVDRTGRIIDIYTVALGAERPPPIPELRGRATVREAAGTFQVTGTNGRFDIDATTGLFKSATLNGLTFPFRGPFLHLYELEEFRGGSTVYYDGPDLSTWKLDSIKAETVDGLARLTVSGGYDGLRARFVYTIGANGRLNVDYTFDDIPALETRKGKQSRGGPLTMEAGIKFQMDDTFDELAWNRNGYWSFYPEGHLSALEGRVPMFADRKPEYRQAPGQPWELDVHDWFYQGVDVPAGKLMPNVAKAAKLGIREYSLIDTDTHTALTVYGNGRNIAGRFNQARDRHYYLYILDTLDYHLRWGNYSANYRPESKHAGCARIMVRAEPQ